MGRWVSRLVLFFVSAVLAGLYMASYVPLGASFYGSVGTLALFGVLLVEVLRKTAERFSAAFLLNSFVSLVVGFGAAAFVTLCAHSLFEEVSLPGSLVAVLRFALPFALTATAFWGFKTFPCFRRECSYGNQVEDRSANGCSPRKFMPDISALEDGRIVDLARTGLFDGMIALPAFLARELKTLSEFGDENARNGARKALEALRRLEALPKIDIQIVETQIPDSEDLNEKILRTAKLKNACLITSESSPLRPENETGLSLAIDAIANALRPPIPKGELLPIKIQRLGKEPKQGIGYLDDGTMVVVNGGGDFLGRTIRTQVLSQKYSSSGKIVFCNVRDDGCEERLLPAGVYLQPDMSSN